MPRTLAAIDPLISLLNASTRPIYAIDNRRRIVYCNAALSAWLEMSSDRIIGRIVEYHSEPEVVRGARQDESVPPLVDLCPPPRALAGETCVATISILARGGRLVYRRAEFVPLGPTGPDSGVLVLVADHDLLPQELAAQVSGEPAADELHRVIRRFRRTEAARYAIETLLGDSSAIHKVRTQVLAAAASGANTLICGRPGSGREHIARAIHYQAAGDSTAGLVSLDGQIANDNLLRRALDALSYANEPRQRPTLLLEHLDQLSPPLQAQVLAAIRQNTFSARIIATCDNENGICPALRDVVSTITIQVPRLIDRLEDLPVLAQFFLEACNRGSEKQVGSLRPEALDLLALHAWPGELDELREIIAAAHQRCPSHEIRGVDLPAVVHHAAHAAMHIRRQPERIVLDELLANIEREAIVRALDQAHGNKSAAAELLGMTRPRLYRRLLQLGLAGPEFMESEDSEEAS